MGLNKAIEVLRDSVGEVSKWLCLHVFSGRNHIWLVLGTPQGTPPLFLEGVGGSLKKGRSNFLVSCWLLKATSSAAWFAAFRARKHNDPKMDADASF